MDNLKATFLKSDFHGRPNYNSDAKQKTLKIQQQLVMLKTQNESRFFPSIGSH